MAKIKFENGTVVNFDGTPTQQDVEEVANKLGLNKKQPLYGNKEEMAKKLAEEKARGEKASKVTLGGVIGQLPKATAKVLGEMPARFAISAAETPGTIKRAIGTIRGTETQPMTTQKEYSLPLIGKFKSFQSEFEPAYQEAMKPETPTMKAFGTAIKPFVQVPLAGLETAGLAKGLVGDITLTGSKAGQVSKGLIPRGIEKIQESRYLKNALTITKPKLTLKNRQQLLKEGRVNMKGKITPNQEDLNIAKAVEQAGVKRHASPDKNIQIIKEEIDSVSNKGIMPMLEKSKSETNIEGLVNKIKAIQPSNEIRISQTGTKTFENVKNVYIDELIANAKNPKAEYASRIKLDSELINATRGKIFDDDVNAVYKAIRQIRQVVNNDIASQVETPQEFLNAMKYEHNLFSGIERIAKNSAPLVGKSFWTTRLGKLIKTGSIAGGGAWIYSGVKKYIK